MGIEDLTQLQIIDGIMGLIYPTVGFIVGITIASKYAKYKRNELLFVGISLCCTVMSYLALGITFLGIVFFDYVLEDTYFFILYLGFSNIGVICWMWAMAILLAPHHTKKIVSVYITYSVVMTIISLLSRYVYTSWALYRRVGPMDVEFAPILSIASLFSLLSILITGILFCRDCFRSENPRVIWKGRFILTSLILLLIGAFLISFNVTNLTLVIFSRVLFVSRMGFSYLGWLLPERIAKMLIKEQE